MIPSTIKFGFNFAEAKNDRINVIELETNTAFEILPSELPCPPSIASGTRVQASIVMKRRTKMRVLDGSWTEDLHFRVVLAERPFEVELRVSNGVIRLPRTRLINNKSNDTSPGSRFEMNFQYNLEIRVKGEGFPPFVWESELFLIKTKTRNTTKYGTGAISRTIERIPCILRRKTIFVRRGVSASITLPLFHPGWRSVEPVLVNSREKKVNENAQRANHDGRSQNEIEPDTMTEGGRGDSRLAGDEEGGEEESRFEATPRDEKSLSAEMEEITGIDTDRRQQEAGKKGVYCRMTSGEAEKRNLDSEIETHNQGSEMKPRLKGEKEDIWMVEQEDGIYREVTPGDDGLIKFRISPKSQIRQSFLGKHRTWFIGKREEHKDSKTESGSAVEPQLDLGTSSAVLDSIEDLEKEAGFDSKRTHKNAIEPELTSGQGEEEQASLYFLDENCEVFGEYLVVENEVEVITEMASTSDNDGVQEKTELDEFHEKKSRRRQSKVTESDEGCQQGPSTSTSRTVQEAQATSSLGDDEINQQAHKCSTNSIAGRQFGELNGPFLAKLLRLPRLGQKTKKAIENLFAKRDEEVISNICSFSRAVQELEYKIYQLSMKDQRESVAQIFAEELEEVKKSIPIREFQCSEGEEFVECENCGGRRHAVCELYSEKSHAKFVCERCRTQSVQRLEARNVFPADNQLTKFIEERIAQRFPKVCVRVLYSAPKKVTVPEAMSTEYPNYPKEFGYVDKFIGVFEDQGNADVMVFAMRVQEYDEECPEPNAKKVNISYLDSVRYLTQDRLKSQLYKEVVRGYFEYAENRGYKVGHIWASPPEPDTDYLFPGRPSYQLVPRSWDLETWYRSVLGHQELDLVQRRGRKAPRLTCEERKFVFTTGDERRFLGKEVDEEGLIERIPLFAGGFWELRIEEVLAKPKKDHQSEAKIVLTREGGKSTFFIHFSSDTAFKRDEDPFVPFELLSDRIDFLQYAEDHNLNCSTLQNAKYFTMKLMEAFLESEASQNKK